MTPHLLRSEAFLTTSAVAPITVGVIAGAASRGWKAAAIAGGATLLGLGLIRWQMQRLFAEQPAYFLEHVRLPIEVRRYDPMLVAESTTANQGYQRLVRYFRVNQLPTTSPVFFTHNFGVPTVRFMLPLNSDPNKPTDQHVHLHQLPARRVAVLCFNGRKRISHERILLDTLGTAELIPMGPLTFAVYDPPSTIAALRRNEVWVDVDYPR